MDMASSTATRDAPDGDSALVKDLVIVGAGPAGLYQLYKAREIGLDAVVVERGGGVGGTWYWNRYPGLVVDAPSFDYSYSFSPELEQEWEWSTWYPSQPEVLSYLEHVAERFDLLKDIRLNTAVVGAQWQADEGRWVVELADGGTISTRFCVMATGCLSEPRAPEIDGVDTFAGRVLHTGTWPHEAVDFVGKRVGIVGTGSSGVQTLPVVAQTAASVTLFQRTPGFSVPARNRPLTEEETAEVKATYRARREQTRHSPGGLLFPPAEKSVFEATPEERQARFERYWELGWPVTLTYTDVSTDKAANDIVADFVRSKIREIVQDPERADLLTRQDYPIGTKRIILDTNYYDTFNRDNVDLVDVRTTPIVSIDRDGVNTTDAHYDVDILIFATGFDAITGALLAMDIVGEQGVRLRDEWAAGPRTYLGLSVAHFPNLFLATGPGSPSVISNVFVSIEQHIEWFSDLFAHMRDHNLATVVATVDAQDDWVSTVNAVAARTLYPTAASWYMGANVPGKPRVFMPFLGGVGNYRKICDEVVTDGYRGFVFEPLDAQVPDEATARVADATTAAAR
ncbi:cyclohexanone monooxygenase [Pseudonocardia sp. N23]|nr:cyclohexanone monooxygenase [Pseudonocardia sp. N23]